MQYNTQRDKLSMPEYGRAVQDMVMHALTIDDRQKRQQCAQTIIDVMANMQPALREQPDYLQKLWDHLAYISNYQLDVDYPYPVTRLDGENVTPEQLAYPKKKIRNRHYGFLLEQLLTHLATMPEGEERDELVQLIADQMKQSLFDWNRDAMDEEKIASDLARYTDGRIQLDIDNFSFGKVVQGMQQGSGKKKRRKK